VADGNEQNGGTIVLNVTERTEQNGREFAAETDRDFAVWDIETGPLDDETLAKLCPPFEPPPHPGEFDPTAVKCGNLGADKAKAKIEEKRKEHEAAVRDYAANCERLKVEHFAKFKANAALDATTGHVVAIGIRGCSESFIIDCDDDAEEAGLRWFWNDVDDFFRQNCPMVGFNTSGFDLPFVVRRSWILGVPIPHGVRQGRFWNPLFIDLMQAWTFGYREFVSLNTLAAAFGLAGKVDEVDGVAVSGAEFHRLWKENRKVAEAYLMRDLELPAELAVRMGVV
jgi:hypothetical protein